MSGTNWLCYKNYNESIRWQPVELLPFPAEIIGLASEVDEKMAKLIVEAPDTSSYFGIPLYTNYLNPGNWNDTFLRAYNSYCSFISAHSLHPTPATDIIFLIKTK